MRPIERALAEAWRTRIEPASRAWQSVIRSWRLRRRYDLRPLARSSLRLALASPRVPDCPSCTGLCCRSPNLVSLRLIDLARFIDAGLESAAVTPRPGGRRAIYAEHPELRRLEQLDSFRRFPVLAQEEGRCVFLGHDDRCTIYAQRPLACRRYPFLLTPDRRAVRWAGGCPLWSTTRDAAERDGLLDDLVEHYEQKQHDLVALEFGQSELERLGLWQLLPTTRRGQRFARVLAERGR